MMKTTRSSKFGFTLIELIVVLAAIGLLLTIATPRYLDALDRGKESIVQQDLVVMRDAIDKFNADQGRYPESLEELVVKRYLRAVPIDPYLDAPSWTIVPPKAGEPGRVYDVQRASAAPTKVGVNP
jgi:general secretion pathway protein G